MLAYVLGTVLTGGTLLAVVIASRVALLSADVLLGLLGLVLRQQDP